MAATGNMLDNRPNFRLLASCIPYVPQVRRILVFHPSRVSALIGINQRAVAITNNTLIVFGCIHNLFFSSTATLHLINSSRHHIYSNTTLASLYTNVQKKCHFSLHFVSTQPTR